MGRTPIEADVGRLSLPRGKPRVSRLLGRAFADEATARGGLAGLVDALKGLIDGTPGKCQLTADS